MNHPRLFLGLTVLMFAPIVSARSQDTSAPPPPPVNPVSPGTSVNGQGAPVKLDPETLQAIRQIVQETIRAQTLTASTQAPQASPQASPQGYAAAPVAQAPVTPVVMVRDKSLFHRAMGHLGGKLSSLGQPTVTQAYIQQTVTPVISMQTVKTRAVQVQASPVPYQVQMIPAPAAPMATPQAPGK